MATTTDQVPSYAKPAVAVLQKMDRKGLEYTYNHMGRGLDKLVVAAGILLMLCDLMTGRVTNILFILITAVAIWLCMLGSACRTYWPELGVTVEDVGDDDIDHRTGQ